MRLRITVPGVSARRRGWWRKMKLIGIRGTGRWTILWLSENKKENC
jgi:hypothetical protein